MDRFEEEIAEWMRIIKASLHSSMDRFEGIKMTNAIVRNATLHSSMDRFEVSQEQRSKCLKSSFTFQYG